MPASPLTELRTSLEPYARGRIAFGIFLLGAGSLHFIAPGSYDGIMPLWVPAPRTLIYLSGVAEMLGGLGLLLRRTRRLASIGVIALLVAVFPANIQMLINWQDQGVSWWAEALLWLRLPLQAVLVWWAWLLGRTGPASEVPQEIGGPRGA